MTHKMATLILAGQRPEPENADQRTLDKINPLRHVAPVHKAFLDMQGTPMITRVLQNIEATNSICNNTISIAIPHHLKNAFEPHTNSHHLISSQTSPATTILAMLDSLPAGTPLLVTSCDHPLLTPQMVEYFLNTIDQDIYQGAAACVTQDVFRADYPEAKRTFINLSDISFSGANLFWFKAGAANPLLQFWRSLEENRKNPLKMASQIGFEIGALYLAGRLSLAKTKTTLTKKTGVAIDLVPLPFAQAAIDVDKPQDIDLVRSLLTNHL